MSADCEFLDINVKFFKKRFETFFKALLGMKSNDCGQIQIVENGINGFNIIFFAELSQSAVMALMVNFKWGHTNCVSPFENDKNNVAA